MRAPSPVSLGRTNDVRVANIEVVVTDSNNHPIRKKPGECISYNVDLVFRSNDQIVSVAVIDNVSKSVGYARESFAKVQ